MNLKGVFKNVGTDLAVGGGIAVSQFALSKVPFMNEKPLLKNVVAYGALKLVGGKFASKKGIIGDVITGLGYGFASTIVAAGLKKVPGMGAIADSYINGTDKYIRIEIPNQSSDQALNETLPAYVAGL